VKVLFDTHAFIWWDAEPDKLSPHAFSVCKDPANTFLLSVATIWEMQIKSQLGKLQLRLPLAELIETQAEANQITVLPIPLTHVLALQDLPAQHKDPFDRMLIAQANAESAVLVGNDAVFAQYPVRLVW
jgi:PIN domain nuclease of toxin-antitoxin system